MGMFNMAQTTGLKESGNFLSAGIHKAKFNGLTLGSITSQKDGSVYQTMTLALDVEGHGEFTHNFFEPTSKERTQSQFGENPSQVEHFMVSLRQIFDALDSKIGDMIDNDNVVIKDQNGNDKKVNTADLDFTKLVKLSKVLTDPYIGTEVEIKLVPQSNGFNSIPGFPAKINRAGALGIATRFIGHNLTLSQSEQRRIDTAQNNRPTNMTSNSNATLEGVADALDIDSSADLPF
jgi:hypothetical protein